ncbi:MAG: hypothetical protein LUE29_09630 [Lachnospiraceae bacterium]|nr:hypothetical protein [Lachnospiraceae bacterium]
MVEKFCVGLIVSIIIAVLGILIGEAFTVIFNDEMDGYRFTVVLLAIALGICLTIFRYQYIVSFL